MAIQNIGTTISGIASDTKPTLTANEKGVIFVETDTNKVYQWDTDSWNQLIATVDDDAITLAKMASGTDGQIITYDASGNPTAVGPGTDGQVLTSTGAGSPPAFEDAGGGGLEEYDIWHLTADTTTEDNDPLDTNFSRFAPANSAFEYISAGSGMEKEAGGIFKFPNTGKWEVIAFASWETGGNSLKGHVKLNYTYDDGSNWMTLAAAQQQGTSNMTMCAPVLIDVDDVDADKVALQTVGDGTLVGQNPANSVLALMTGMIFKKMGST